MLWCRRWRGKPGRSHHLQRSSYVINTLFSGMRIYLWIREGKKAGEDIGVALADSRVALATARPNVARLSRTSLTMVGENIDLSVAMPMVATKVTLVHTGRSGAQNLSVAPNRSP